MDEFDVQLVWEAEVEAGVHHPGNVRRGVRLRREKVGVVCSRHLVHVHPEFHLAGIAAQSRQIPPEKNPHPSVPHFSVAQGHLGEVVFEFFRGYLFACVASGERLCCQVCFEELFV